MTPRVRLGRLFGVDVEIAVGWFVTFVVAAWTLVQIADRALPQLGYPALALLAATATAVLFASLVLHEIVHARVERRLGAPVRRIVLFLLGGVTDVEAAPASIRAEIPAAVAGPASSLLVGAAFAALTIATFGAFPTRLDDVARVGPLGALLAWTAAANLGIAAFNALPAYPLDGGRIVRALVWWSTGDVERATRWAAWSGQVFGWGGVIGGIAVALGTRGVGVAIGMWVAFAGWFLASAAAQAYEGVVLEDVLDGVRVARVMRRRAFAVPGDVSVATAVRGWLARDPLAGVVDGDRFVGVLSMRDVDALGPDAWARTRARDLARTDRAFALAPSDLASDALRRLGELEVEHLPVVEGGRIVGGLARDDVLEWIAYATTRARAPTGDPVRAEVRS